MSGPALIDVEVQRGRLVRMVVIDALCVLVAAAALIGDLGFHREGLIWVFASAVVAGFAAQIWLVAGLMRRQGSV
ncbi:MAG TPA: hypothetical protein VHX64_04650 [Caulobacteraceae bacterium]|jgi:hypothetical protein|nr:hypothetical protein [Caulobacteraceae bacterium]